MNNQKQKDLGIFYTPQTVVNFIFQILLIMKNKENKEKKRWQSHKPPHFPSVIDPACGEGIFLKTAVTSGFTGYHPRQKTPYVFGVDLDGEVVKKWEKISILHDLFKNNKKKMLDHFHQQNGLLELPSKVFNYKTGGLKKFDAVVGNPPYGGTGIDNLTPELENSLFDFRIWKKAIGKGREQGDQLGLIIQNQISTREKKRLEKFPIEILFVDRFIQLAKPNGLIALIIPDGILANSTFHYVRQFIAENTKVAGIISLPRETFKQAGTNAKTSILILQKQKTSNMDYPIFLASTEAPSQSNFDKISIKFKKFYD